MTAKVRKAIIVDAGYASRFLPITKTLPKAMLPLGNKPTIQLLIEECVEAGIEEIIVVCIPEAKSIYEDYFTNAITHVKKFLDKQGKAERYAPVQEVLDFPKIIVIAQDSSLPYGTASPIISAKSFVENEPAFVVLQGDDVVFGKKKDTQLLKDAFEKDNSLGAITMGQEITMKEITKYGMIAVKDEKTMILDNIIEKPDKWDKSYLLANYGRHLLTPEIFEYMKPEMTGKDGELWTVDAITKLAKVKPVKVLKNQGKWMTTGDPDNYIRTYLAYLVRNGKDKGELIDMIDSA